LAQSHPDFLSNCLFPGHPTVFDRGVPPVDNGYPAFFSMPTLQLHLPDTGIVTHELSGKDVVTVGWAKDNTIQITDPSISRHHAQLIREGNSYRLKDLGSTNKSWINGSAVNEALIRDADNLRFGAVECVFRIRDTEEKPTLAAGAATVWKLIVNLPGSPAVTHRLEGDKIAIGWKPDNEIQIADPS